MPPATRPHVGEMGSHESMSDHTTPPLVQHPDHTISRSALKPSNINPRVGFRCYSNGDRIPAGESGIGKPKRTENNRIGRWLRAVDYRHSFDCSLVGTLHSHLYDALCAPTHRVPFSPTGVGSSNHTFQPNSDRPISHNDVFPYAADRQHDLS